MRVSQLNWSVFECTSCWNNSSFDHCRAKNERRMIASSRRGRVVTALVNCGRRRVAVSRLSAQSWPKNASRVANERSTRTTQSTLLASSLLVDHWRLQPLRPAAVPSHFYTLTSTYATPDNSISLSQELYRISLGLSLCLCVCVCLFTRIFPEPHARSLPILVHVAYVRGSILLQHIHHRPHRLSAGTGWRECIARAKSV